VRLGRDQSRILGYARERNLHVAKPVVTQCNVNRAYMTCAREYCEGNRKKLLKARKRSEMLGNVRERSRGVATKGDKEIVVERENNEISAYRRMTDLSSPPFFNFDCPQSIERRVLDRGHVDMQMNSEFWVLEVA